MAPEPDWLAIPEEDKLPEKISDTAALIEADHTKPPVVSQQALAVAKQHSDERETFVRAWNDLTTRQQVFLRALQQTGFSNSRALKVLNEAVRLDPTIAGSRSTQHKLGLTTVQRWARENASFKIVLNAMKAEIARQVTSRDDLLLRAHRAAEYAEEEQPILYQGEHTGFVERKPDVMLRANEQIAKITKVLGGEEKGPTGAVGPSLVIQVVQRDGALVDVTPKGVTIDLPRPGGS
jgi:hypothetical protein